MDAAQTLMDERMLAELEAEVRPLVAEVRAALADALADSGRDTLTRFLTDAPVGASVRLAEVWDMARALGLPTDQVKARFTVEEQFLIDMVASLYAPPLPGTPIDPPALGECLDDPAEPSD